MTSLTYRHWAALLAAAVLLAATSAWAQDAPSSNAVADIRVEGNQHYSTSSILVDVKTRVGQPYDEAVARDDQQRLMKTGRFESVKVTRAAGPEGVVVVFEVVERPTLAAVTIEGNKTLTRAQLSSELGFSTGSPLNRLTVETGRQAILNKYHSQGFPDATVVVDEDALRTDRRLVYRITEGPRVTVNSIRFQGNHFYNGLELRMKVGSTAKFWPFTTGYLDSEQLEKDVDTIRNLYVAEGFLDAKVGRTLEYTQGGTKLTVVFVIDEGPRYRVGRITFQGNEVFADPELMRRLNLLPGRFITALAVNRDAQKLQDAYGELGYINATVAPERSYREQPGIADLQYRIAEGEKYTVGQVIIRGNSVTQSRVIRRDVGLYPEQAYNTVAAEESRRRLQEARLFKTVSITPLGREGNVRDSLVQVEEDQTAQFIVGASVSTNAGLMGNFSITQRNFDILRWPTAWADLASGKAWKGAGQTFTIAAEPGTEVMRFHIDWFEPSLFDGPHTLGAKAFFFNRARENYDETRFGAVGSIGRHLPNRWYAELAVTPENVVISDLDHDAPRDAWDVEGDNFQVGFKGSLLRDSTDSRWIPTAGDRFRVSYEEVVGDQNFGRAIGDYRTYHTVYLDPLDRKHVLAGRVGLGQIIGDAPIYERFYGGGQDSIRGFHYRGITPRDEHENPLGGKFSFFAGTEYEYPLIGDQLRGVFFLDSGTVEKDFQITTYRVSAGFGLRWIIPFLGPVPMNLDFGFPIRKDSNDDTQIFSFSIGMTF